MAASCPRLSIETWRFLGKLGASITGSHTLRDKREKMERNRLLFRRLEGSGKIGDICLYE